MTEMETWDRLQLRHFQKDREAEIFCVLLFPQRDALLLNRDFKLVLRVSETDAINLMIEAAFRKLVCDSRVDFSAGERPDGFPKVAKKAIFFSRFNEGEVPPSLLTRDLMKWRAYGGNE